jgi:hypothetical protein
VSRRLLKRSGWPEVSWRQELLRLKKSDTLSKFVVPLDYVLTYKLKVEAGSTRTLDATS